MKKIYYKGKTTKVTDKEYDLFLDELITKRRVQNLNSRCFDPVEAGKVFEECVEDLLKREKDNVKS